MRDVASPIYNSGLKLEGVLTQTQIALVGFGKIARDQHVPAIMSHAGFALAAAVDPQKLSISLPRFSDIAGLRASGISVDAVAICTPPQARAAVARAALTAGWHVLLEKPPTATLAELAELVELARVNNVALFAAWHSREAAMVAPARAWLQGRQITRVMITWREDVRRWHPGQTWLWAPGGLGVFDPGINAFSILTSLLPNAVAVTAATLLIPEDAHTPIAAQLAMRSGITSITADLDFSQTGPQTWNIVMDTACRHRLDLTNGGSHLAIDGAAMSAPANAEYPALYDRFADLIMRRAIDADGAPLRLVADALLLAEIRRAPPFIE